jgi:sterol desaturase/sphingolipid hydroxylase (fatty acid hydroxylase superfamily)
MDEALQLVVQAFGQAQQALFEVVIQPVMFKWGLANFLEDGYAATGWFLVGIGQIVFLITVVRALEYWRPVEPILDRLAVQTDMIYTVIHRLGLFRLALFFLVDPVWDTLFSEMALWGVIPWHLDAAVAPGWLGVTDTAWFAFLVYLVIFDLFDYWFHRGQHYFQAWWALHSLHHSQRQMTLWSDNRNHLMDDVLRDSMLVVLAKLIGVAPGQFVALVVSTQLLESLSHANVRMSFGWLGDRILVSPQYHRLHHSIGIGHESQGPHTLGGHNYAVLFPVWDILWGTARFNSGYPPTGIRDQLPEYGAHDYGKGFWQQQIMGLKRMSRSLRN